MSQKDVVLLSTADWDNPFWTNKQHVAVSLAERGYRVLYIDSLGLRRPSVSSRDIRRVLKRLKKGVRRPREVRKNIWVWSPILLPFNGVPFVRLLNRVLLGLGLSVSVRRLHMRQPWLWTYNPLTEQLLDLSVWSKVIYHCVDEIKAQPGMPAEALECAENSLVKRADLVFVTSTTLESSRRRINPQTYYLSNVADYRHFAKAMHDDTAVPVDLSAIPAPRIGFVGAISGYKIDFCLLRTIAERMPQWSLVLIGEVGEGDPWTDPSMLEGVPNIHLIGPRPYSSLPAYLKGIDVAILPNRLNEYTASMFPMKFFEYLAAGKPVISTQLPSLNGHGEIAYLASSEDDFISGIEQALRGQGPSLDDRLRHASAHTYEGRLARMLSLVEGISG